MKQIGIAPSALRFNEAGLPICGRFNQPYLSQRAGGVSVRNLIAKADLNGFGSDKESNLTVLEIGFGLGANFLATVARHEQTHRHRRGLLNYVAFEVQPVCAKDLARAWHACGIREGNERAADLLLAQWPLLIRGAHRIRLADDIELTLIFDDAMHALTDVQCAADMLILDAYPATINPSLWSDKFVRLLALRSRVGATLISESNSPATRDQFGRVGFEVVQSESSQPMSAKYRPKFHPSRSSGFHSPRMWPTKTAIVVGAGLAGMQCARELTAGGWQVSIVDQRLDLTAAPQQQPAIAAHPHFSVDDNPLARLTRTAFLLSRADPHPLRAVGRLMLVGDEQFDVLAPLLKHSPDRFAQRVNAQQASEIAGTLLSSSALWLPEMPIRISEDQPHPQALADTLGIAWLPATELSDLQFRDGLWHCVDNDQRPIGSASVVVLATGHLPNVLRADLWPGVLTQRGQSTTIQTDSLTLRCVVGGSSYACPLPGENRILAGATAVDAMTEQDLSTNDRRNRDRLGQLTGRLPEHFTVLNRHLGTRSTTRDHLPMIGPMPDLAGIVANAEALSANDRLPVPSHPGLYLASGFGGRGLLWSYLAARCITDHVNNLTSLLPTPLEQAIAPNRFIRRALRQGEFRAPLVTSPQA